MEYRLTLPTLVVGSLTVCILFLASAWVLDLLRHHTDRSRQRTSRTDNGRTFETERTFGRDGGRASEARSLVALGGNLSFRDSHNSGR